MSDPDWPMLKKYFDGKVSELLDHNAALRHVLRQELSQEELEDLLLPPEGERGITVDIVREVYESDGLPEDLTSDVIAGTLKLCKEDVKVVTKENAVLTKLLVESLGSEEDLKMLLPPPFGTNGTKKKETEEPKEPTQPKEPKPVMPGGWLLERAREGLKGTQGVTTVKDDQQKHSSLSNDERYEVLELEYAEAKAECERRGEMLNEVTQYTELLEVRVRQVDEEHAAYRQRMEQERDTLKMMHKHEINSMLSKADADAAAAEEEKKALVEFMAKELDKAVEEKQKELEEERRLRQELADITEKVAQDMERDMDSKDEKIKELRVQIALAEDGKLHDELAACKTTIKQLKKQLAKEKERRISAQVSAGISPDDDEDDDEEVPPPVETPVNDAVIVLSPPEPKVDPEVASKARLEGKLANIRKQLLKSQQLYGTALGGA